MTPLEVLIRQIQRQLPQLGVLGAESLLDEAAGKFFGYTTTWRESIDAESTLGVIRPVSAVADTSVCAVIGVSDFEGKPIPLMTENQLNRRAPGWRRAAEGGTVYGFFSLGDAVTVVRPQVDTTVFECRVALRPERVSAVPEELLTRYGQILVDGALATAYVVPGTDYRDMRLANQHLALFTRSLEIERSRASYDSMSAAVGRIRYGGL